jgi:plasmid stabilization system protein ParE
MSEGLKWSELAIRDVEAWIEWVRKDSEYQSGRVGLAIIEMAENIASRPLSGHIVPELHNEQLRYRLLYGRRMVYEVRKECVVIKRIISCKMQFVKEYERDLE